MSVIILPVRGCARGWGQSENAVVVVVEVVVLGGSETVIRQKRGECAKIKEVSQRDTEKAE